MCQVNANPQVVKRRSLPFARMRAALTLLPGRVTLPPARSSKHVDLQRQSMRLPILILLAGALLAAQFDAQPTPEPQPPKPKPGQILERPNAGKITNAPEAPTAPAPGQVAGQRIERFEVTGNTSVASDTIRVYLGVNIGEVFDPDVIQKNYLNLWQTGLFDDIKIETDKG